MDDLVGRHEVEAPRRRAAAAAGRPGRSAGSRRGAELALGGDDALAQVERDDGGVRQAREPRGVAAEAGAGLEHRPLVGQEGAQAVLVAEPEALDVPAVLRLDALADLVVVDARPLRRERVERPGLVAERARLAGHEARDAVADREAVPVGAGRARVAAAPFGVNAAASCGQTRVRADRASSVAEDARRRAAGGRPWRRKRSRGRGRRSPAGRAGSAPRTPCRPRPG